MQEQPCNFSTLETVIDGTLSDGTLNVPLNDGPLLPSIKDAPEVSQKVCNDLNNDQEVRDKMSRSREPLNYVPLNMPLIENQNDIGNLNGDYVSDVRVTCICPKDALRLTQDQESRDRELWEPLNNVPLNKLLIDNQNDTGDLNGDYTSELRVTYHKDALLLPQDQVSRDQVPLNHVPLNQVPLNSFLENKIFDIRGRSGRTDSAVLYPECQRDDVWNSLSQRDFLGDELGSICHTNYFSNNFNEHINDECYVANGESVSQVTIGNASISDDATLDQVPYCSESMPLNVSVRSFINNYVADNFEPVITGRTYKQVAGSNEYSQIVIDDTSVNDGSANILVKVLN